MQPTATVEKQVLTKYRLAADKAAVIRTNPPHNMSVMEGAAYIGISPRKLRDIIQSRRVKCARLGSKIILRRESLDELATVGAA